MNLQRILCPVDFSEFNQAANEYASLLARSTGAAIVYFHASLPEVPYGSYTYADMEPVERRNLNRLEEITPTVEGVEASWVVEFGPPAERIVEYANENRIDLIVMGTHGRTGLSRVLTGSVAEAVVRQAECPVLAVKADSKLLQAG